MFSGQNPTWSEELENHEGGGSTIWRQLLEGHRLDVESQRPYDMEADCEEGHDPPRIVGPPNRVCIIGGCEKPTLSQTDQPSTQPTPTLLNNK